MLNERNEEVNVLMTMFFRTLGDNFTLILRLNFYINLCFDYVLVI